MLFGKSILAGADAFAEAEVFNAYLQEVYHVSADLLECESTSCGNNITLLLELLKANGMENLKSVILCQDAAMQLRMAAGICKVQAGCHGDQLCVLPGRGDRR